MNTSKRWRLRHWIIAGYAVPIIALIGSATVAVLNVGVVKDRARDLAMARDISLRINDMMVGLQIDSRATRGYLLDPSPISLQSAEEARDRYEEDIQILEGMIQDAEQMDRLNRLEALTNELRGLNENLIAIASGGNLEAAINAWKTDDGRGVMEEITALILEMETAENAIVDNATEQQAAALRGLQMSLIVATLFSLVVSGMIGTWVISRTSRQMNESASSIAASTTEIATTVEQQERTASQQAASVNETTTTMEELGASSRQSAEQAEAAAAGARQALDLAGNGTRAVERTMEGMGELRQKVGAIADQILRLSEQTNQIGSISGLVSDLANQTNMLALNAAVEAVRAGEHGKGFAVVAGEIRKLADQSRTSAERIGALVTDIQNAINSTVMVTDEGTKTVEEGVRIAQETSNSFNGVADAVNNVVLNSQQISLNVKQQSIAIQQVVDAMNSLNVAARETASGISQIRVGTQRLNDAATDLKAVV
jgi:methyl-accepting chemotaxis protein